MAPHPVPGTTRKGVVMATVAKQGVAAVAGTTGRRRINWTPYLFILPHLIFFAVFVGYPFFRGLYLSLLDFDYLRPEATKFLGLQNYINIFVPGGIKFNEFWNALFNT